MTLSLQTWYNNAIESEYDAVLRKENYVFKNNDFNIKPTIQVNRSYNTAAIFVNIFTFGIPLLMMLVYAETQKS